MEILKIFSIQKDNTRERDEMKAKLIEIKHTKPKEIEHHKWMLEEQVFSQFCRSTFFFHKL